MLRSSSSISFFHHIHWGLVTFITLMAVVSIWNLHGTTGPYVSRVYINQMYWFLIGGGVMTVVALMDDHLIRRWTPIFYIGVMIALVLVLVIGKKVNGSRRWIDLGFFTFQPSELAKLAVILVLASWFQNRPKPDGYQFFDLIPIALLLGLPMFLIFQEPDLGHTLMILLIALTMMSYEKFRRKTVIGALFSALAFMPIAWMFILKRYQKERILTLIDGKVDRLGAGWHSYQATVAVGSGGLSGKGHLKGTQVMGGFLPENHTDFVFAKWAEEYGFIGSSFVLLLYLGMILCILYSAYTARDRFGTHVALGVGALLFWHVMMNIGMVINLLPVTGVTLPLMSYGGSSVLTIMIAFGLVLNIHARRHLF